MATAQDNPYELYNTLLDARVSRLPFEQRQMLQKSMNDPPRSSFSMHDAYEYKPDKMKYRSAESTADELNRLLSMCDASMGHVPYQPSFAELPVAQGVYRKRYRD